MDFPTLISYTSPFLNQGLYQHSVKISHSNSMNPVQFDAFSGLIWIQTICTKIIATSKWRIITNLGHYNFPLLALGQVHFVLSCVVFFIFI